MQNSLYKVFEHKCVLEETKMLNSLSHIKSFESFIV